MPIKILKKFTLYNIFYASRVKILYSVMRIYKTFLLGTFDIYILALHFVCYALRSERMYLLTQCAATRLLNGRLACGCGVRRAAGGVRLASHVRCDRRSYPSHYRRVYTVHPLRSFVTAKIYLYGNVSCEPRSHRPHRLLAQSNKDIMGK